MVDILAAPRQAKTDSSLRTLIAISTAHWVSHFHLFVLPMLFPFLKQQLGVGYIELGFALTMFAVVSGLTQAPIGYLADRIGARKILLIGLSAGGFALMMLGVHLSYSWLIASAVLLGLANSVYHPADYAILSAHMDEARMGRAFSIHTFAGFLGGAVAPAIVAALVATTGGHGALIVAGAVGPVVALLLLAVGIPDAGAADRGADGAKAPQPNVVTPAIIVLTAFFMLLSLSTAGIGNFGVVALMSGYGASFSTANIALTALLGCSAVGVLAGGFLADRTHRHGQFAAACFALNAAIVLLIAIVRCRRCRSSRRWRRRDFSAASLRHRATCWFAMRRLRAPPVAPSASSPPASISAASSARYCSAGSWIRTCRIGCSAPRRYSWSSPCCWRWSPTGTHAGASRRSTSGLCNPEAQTRRLT
jgi:MFS family permease